MNFWTVFSMDLGRQDWTGRHSPHLDLPRRVQDFPRSAAWLQPWSIGSLTGTRGLGGWVSEAKVVVAQALGALGPWQESYLDDRPADAAQERQGLPRSQGIHQWCNLAFFAQSYPKRIIVRH